jgi:hypothetical protein
LQLGIYLDAASDSSWIPVLGKKEILYGNYPDENLHARHMKQLLVFAGDVGDKFFEPSTLPCFDKVAVKDRNLDSDFIWIMIMSRLQESK